MLSFVDVQYDYCIVRSISLSRHGSSEHNDSFKEWLSNAKT